VLRIASLAAVFVVLLGASLGCTKSGATGVPFVRGETRLLSGTVTESVVAGPYSYVTFRLDDGSIRTVATLGAHAQPGDGVDVKAYGLRDSFHSTRLDRTFAPLDFGVVHVR
jgi:hypothetical protein